MAIRLAIGEVDDEGNTVLTYNVPSTETDTGEETRQVMIAGPRRTLQAAENTQAQVLLSLAIHEQLTRIADALEALAQAPESKTARAKSNG